MARSLLVVPAADGTGPARTCLGLLRALDRSGVHMAYVKPVAQPRADGTRAQVVSIGPMLQGLAKPVNDLSRGALVEDVIYTIALTAIQARAS